MNPVEFAERHLGRYKVKGGEIIPTYCPFCNGGEHRDQNTFALNINKLTYNCKRGSCGRSGAFYELCKECGEEADSEMEYNSNFERRPQPKKIYKPPVKNILSPSEKVIEYLHTRKISDAAIEKYKVGADEHGNIIFPYYDEIGDHVMNKFKVSHKFVKGQDKMKSWREAEGKPILWGMWLCDTTKPLIITEGEPDTLALATCGIENVVSVPSGTEDMEWVELCWSWLEQFNKIIIWGDNDEAGQKMIKTLLLKLGEDRCYTVQSERKDANVALFMDGPEKVIELVNEAKPVPITGLLRLADVENFDYSKIERVSSGISLIDKAIGGFMMGQVSIWTGSNSSGKSTFLGQVMVESIDHDFNVCAYSGELPAALFKYWTELQIAGKDNLAYKFDELKQDDVAYVPELVQSSMRNWYRDKFFLYDSFGSTKDDDILKIFGYAAQRYNCKVFLIDNLMTTDFSGNDKDFYRAQSAFVSKVVEFAHKYNVHVHIVAHPRKVQGNVTKFDISGSGDITNRADNVFSVSRLDPNDPEEKELFGCNTRVDILKNRFSGRQDVTIGLKFEPDSKRFYPASENNGYLKEYGWNKAEQTAIYEVHNEEPWE